MTLEQLSRQIDTTKDLRNIVSTMKMLSSVSINQYTEAQKGLAEYRRILFDGFRALAANGHLPTKAPLLSQLPRTLILLIGSDNGLVGSFNKNILTKARLKTAHLPEEFVKYMCIGRRLCAMASFNGLKPLHSFAVSNTVAEIADMSFQLVRHIDRIKSEHKIERVLLIYNCRTEKGIHPVTEQIMPFPKELFVNQSKKWSGKSFPMIDQDVQTLFFALINEYLTILISDALITSLRNEHYMRMVTMQQAEQNIDESLEELNLIYAQNRQTAITDELIDIISGADSLMKKSTELRLK